MVPAESYLKRVIKFDKDHIKRAKEMLVRYDIGIDDEAVDWAVRQLITQMKESDSEILESDFNTTVTEPKLINEILTYYIDHLSEQVNRQLASLFPYDKGESYELRKKLLWDISDILKKPIKGETVKEELTSKLTKIQAVSERASLGNFESLKDTQTLNLFKVIISLIKLCCMILTRGFYQDREIAAKTSMGNSWGILWSGKSLNTLRMEQLQSNLEKINQIHNGVAAVINKEEENELTL